MLFCLYKFSFLFFFYVCFALDFHLRGGFLSNCPNQPNFMEPLIASLCPPYLPQPAAYLIHNAAITNEKHLQRKSTFLFYM